MCNKLSRTQSIGSCDLAESSVRSDGRDCVALNQNVAAGQQLNRLSTTATQLDAADS